MYPVLFRLNGLIIYAYGFFIALAFLFGLILIALRARKEGILFDRIVDLFFYTALSAVIGSRLLFVLINFSSFRIDPLQALKIWEGGLVFYGGLIFGITVSIGYLRRHGLPIWKFADLFSPSLSLGLFFGRLGCFFAGCCYGKETPLPWGVIFRNPNSLAPLNVSLHPVQLLDAANGLTLFLILICWEKRKTFDGQIFWLFLLLYSINRFFIELLRGDPRGFFFWGLFSTSQAIGIILAIISLFMLFYLCRKKISNTANDNE